MGGCHGPDPLIASPLWKELLSLENECLSSGLEWGVISSALENRHTCMNRVSLFFLPEKKQLVEGFPGVTSFFVYLSCQGWVMDNSRWKTGGRADRRLEGWSPLGRRICRVVSWGPEVGAGVRKGPGVNTKTSRVMAYKWGCGVREMWSLVFNLSPSQLPFIHSTFFFNEHLLHTRDYVRYIRDAWAKDRGHSDPAVGQAWGVLEVS